MPRWPAEHSTFCRPHFQSPARSQASACSDVPRGNRGRPPAACSRPRDHLTQARTTRMQTPMAHVTPINPIPGRSRLALTRPCSYSPTAISIALQLPCIARIAGPRRLLRLPERKPRPGSITCSLGTSTDCAWPAASDDCSARPKQECTRRSSTQSEVVHLERLAPHRRRVRVRESAGACLSDAQRGRRADCASELGRTRGRPR
jgi:hypothetical protein